jgi:hypothetical protein
VATSIELAAPHFLQARSDIPTYLQHKRPGMFPGRNVQWRL